MSQATVLSMRHCMMHQQSRKVSETLQQRLLDVLIIMRLRGEEKHLRIPCHAFICGLGTKEVTLQRYLKHLCKHCQAAAATP